MPLKAAVPAIARSGIAPAAVFVPVVPRVAEAIRLFNEAYSKTEEKRVHTLSKLLHTEERMRLAVESAGFATWERSSVTKELYWDERCRVIFGVSDDRKFYYADFLERIHPEERATVQALESTLAESHEYNATFRIMREDGEIRNVISRGRAFCNADSRSTRLVGILIDVTH